MHKKTRSARKLLGLFVAVVGVLAIALATPLGATARDFVTSPEIKDGAVHSQDLHNGGVRSQDLHDKGVHQKDLTDRLVDRLGRVPTHAYESDTVPVANVGGSFGKFTETVRATTVDSFTLQPGRYVIDADGFFVTTTADPARDVRMQLALRVADGSDWGLDYGTAFTNVLSPLADREATTSSTRVVNVTDPTEVQVLAFGYEDDQGSGASGQVDVHTYVTAQRIG